MPTPTPLHDTAARRGASFTDEAGWLVPAHFGAAEAEYRHACDGAALFDLSGRGKVEVAGKDAVSFLNNLSTNDIKNLPVGAGCEAFIATAKARAVAHVLIFRLPPEQPPALRLDVAPGMAETVLKHLDHYLISEQVELTDSTREYAQLHLCGPQARATLEKALGEKVADLTGLRHEQRSFRGGLLHIRRHDLLNLPGYDLLCPSDGAPALWQALTEAGAAPAGQRAFEILRVEAGVPIFGKDIDENRLVFEAGRNRQAISYTKGCYLGQEPVVMARDRGHINRTLLGLVFAEGGAAPPGAKVFHGGQEVGQVTSSVVSPRLGKAVALAYIRRGSEVPGTAVEVEAEGGRRSASVAPLPLVGTSP